MMRSRSLALAAVVACGLTAGVRAQPITDPIVTLVEPSGGFLGVGVAELGPERARELKLPDERGVEVTMVSEGSPAEKAGLRVQDVVLEYNGTRVEGFQQFSRLVHETPVGRQATLSVNRGGQVQKITATIGRRPERGPRIAVAPRPQPGGGLIWRSPVAGVDAEGLTPQLAEYFGVKAGLLVRGVEAGSAGQKAGIRAGDVIVKVEGDPVFTVADLARALRRNAAMKTTLTVVRDKREMELTLPLEPSKMSWPPRGDAFRIFTRV